jgi:hypothetical protein
METFKFELSDCKTVREKNFFFIHAYTWYFSTWEKNGREKQYLKERGKRHKVGAKGEK